MAPPSRYAIAESERTMVEHRLDCLDQYLLDHNTTALTEAEADQYLEMASDTKSKILEIDQVIHTTAPAGEDLTNHRLQIRTFMSRAVKIYSQFRVIKLAFPVPASSAAAHPHPPPSSSRVEVRLPTLELPSFDGNLQDWVAFKDLFESAIGSKASLTKTQKLAYLKSCLQGEASRLVKSLIVCDANYDLAWKALSDRYQNNRELVFHILRRFTSQQNVNNSAPSIRSLVDTSKECLRSLEVIGLPVKQWSAITLFLLFQKLDQTSKELWEQSLKPTTVPTIDDLFEFLEQRARSLAAGSSFKTTHGRNEGHHNKRTAHNHHIQTSSPTCTLSCGKSHFLYKCDKFNQMNVTQRKDHVKKANLCHNCLMEGHFSTNCSSKHSCKTCGKRHHTMIHAPPQSQPPQQSTNQGRGPTPATAPAASSPVGTFHVQEEDHTIKTALLATATVRIIGSHGESYHVRALLDGGSSVSFITEACTRRLRLQLSKSNISITGLQSSSVGVSKGMSSFVIRPRFSSSHSYTMNALCIPKITSRLPTSKLDVMKWPHLQGLLLADEGYHTPAPVDILIGADLFWNIILPDKVENGRDAPVAINSTLGWLVAGQQESTPSTVETYITDLALDNALTKFWESESIPDTPTMTTEEVLCEDHFQHTHQRLADGRFMIQIPWKSPRPALGDSRPHALMRLLHLERRLTVSPNLLDPVKIEQRIYWREEYNKFMMEYERLGHMTLIPKEEVLSPKHPVSYIPHHFIEKTSSTSTKFRVVFDASAKTSSTRSLNDLMMVGPRLQDLLIDIQIRFRVHHIAFKADIEKMFRQILLTTPDRDMHRILWRPHPSQPVQEYWLNTVTYGTASAPYTSVKCLQQLAKDGEAKYPLAARAMLADMFVDDLMSGSSNASTAIAVNYQLIALSQSGGFVLRKWTCNSEEVLATLPDDMKETQSLIPIDEDHSVKALGVFWNPKDDNYHFRIELPAEQAGRYTKRIILSEASKIFDPLGWLAPVIITAKILIQTLWKDHLDWDTTLPDDIQTHWLRFRSSLKSLEAIRVPRCIIPDHPIHIALCGFSDASQVAYGAVVYSVCYYDNHPPQATLIVSKTGVAPKDATTLPRLELAGALLLSKAMMTTVRAMKMPIEDVRCFTDSMIVLSWIQSGPARWKTYVKNRVQKIYNKIPNATWYHIAGERNPADCASRGISAEELINHPMWWNGVSEMFEPPSTEIPDQHQEEAEVKTFHATPAQVSMFQRFSKFTRLQRVVAWIRRFYHNSRTKVLPRHKSPVLTVDELNESFITIIKVVQKTSFPTELQLLKNGKQLPVNSNILALYPFISPDGVLRVGGRLVNAPIPEEQRHPILLPRNNHITNIIIADAHDRYYHAGPTFTLSVLTQRYWIICAKDAVRYQLNKCITCKRHKGETMNQLMGNLPAARVTPSPPFSKCGVDYAGPFITKPPIRSRVTLNSYMAIFVCFATKAIHLEVVSSLSTDAFIAALRRFISRRGMPTDIYSDCGTNFVGAKRCLNELFKLSLSDVHSAKVADVCSSNGIQWHLNPPGSPHFGGLWEAGVKSVKHHLTRVMGTNILTQEELQTLLIQIEAVLNSRPIIPSSSDPSDLSVLTPAHFLIGRPLVAFPDRDLTEINVGRVDRYQLIQQQQQYFWRRWSNEYISRMQQRPKWMMVRTDLKVGDMVIIKDENLPPMRWKLGRVEEIHPAENDMVRVATVRTSTGFLQRTIAKLCLLPVHDEASSPQEAQEVVQD